MRRNYISPEFKYSKENGTFNMIEERSFMGSKMLEIEDSIIIDNRDIIYYQKSNGEQVSLSQEKLLPPVIYSMTKQKKSNHLLVIDEHQTEFEKLNNTKWILEINIGDLLRNYIFSQLKSSRVFENVLNSNTRKNNTNQAIYDYVEQNVLDKYRFEKIDLYLKYNSLLEPGNFQSTNIPIELLESDKLASGTSPTGDDIDPSFLVSNGNVYMESTYVSGSPKINIEDKIQSDLSYNQDKLIIKFKQSKKRSEYNFNYYFNIIFKKI